MATADVIQLEALLAPIPGDKPAGVDLRADANPASDYFKLKDSRFAARAKEREIDAGAEVGDLPEWRTILELAPKLLTTQTKDLEVAAWLELPDHCAYDERELAQVADFLGGLAVEQVVCTRKDLVKIPREEIAGKRLLALEIEVDVVQGREELERVLSRVITEIA